MDKCTVGRRDPKIGYFRLDESAILRAPAVNNNCLKISGILKITNKRNVFSLILYQPFLVQKV